MKLEIGDNGGDMAMLPVCPQLSVHSDLLNKIRIGARRVRVYRELHRHIPAVIPYLH